MRFRFIHLTVILLLLSAAARGQQDRTEPVDSFAYDAKEILVHGHRLLGFIKADTFYLTTAAGKTLLKNGGGPSTWKFEDFNGDGFKDIILEYNNNTPDEKDLYLYVPTSNQFVRIQHFLGFPAARRVTGAHYYYSYRHSGCADQDWDSDLFYLRDFQAVRLGNISGVGCPADEHEPGAIYVHKIQGARKILVKKYLISVIQAYPDNKWGFIKQYWTRNYRLFEDSLSIRSGQYFISADFAMDTVMDLQEIREDNAYIKQQTKGKRKLFPLLYGEPDKEHPYYWVAVGEDNGMAFVTHYGFYVYATSGVIKFCEPLTGRAIDLEHWRKNGRKR
jgi:hypothetical protein